jgi:ribonuclease III
MSSRTLPVADLDGLEQRVGWSFTDRDLLARAMAHRSWCSENDEQPNERLEFLGDAVLGLVVTKHIYAQYPALPEGDLAKLRASVVNSSTLAEVAQELDLGASLLLGKGEDATGGREKSSILADAVEAVIGAVYLDGGWAPADELVMRLLQSRITEYAAGPGGGDFKTRLQELVAHRFEQLPVYRVSGAGPDHAKVFEANVFVLGLLRGTGTGRSKKQAEQAAAAMAWKSLEAAASDDSSAKPVHAEAGISVTAEPTIAGSSGDSLVTQSP